MRSKKILALLLTLLLTMGIAACQSQPAAEEEPGAADSGQTTESDEAEEPAEEPTEEPAEEPTDEPAEEPTEEPAEETTEGEEQEETTAEGDFSDLRVAMLTSGPINDDGWNQVAYEGLLALQENGAEIANTENVAQADQLDLMRSYADQGFDVIIGHGFEYGDALLAAAEEYPDVSFIQIGGVAANDSNLVSYVFQPGEGGYVSGIVAGMMMPDGNIGGVGAVEIPTIAADFNAYTQAAQTVNPNVEEVPVAYTGSWVDIPKAKEAALAMIDNGVGLILADGDNANVGVIEAAQEAGDVYAIGWTKDQSHLAPDLVLTSIEQRVDVILVDAITAIQDGSIEWGNHVVGYAEGAADVAPFHPDVPQEVIDEVNGVIEALSDGRIELDDEGNVVKDEYHE